MRYVRSVAKTATWVYSVLIKLGRATASTETLAARGR
jgi:hypothetical protein